MIDVGLTLRNELAAITGIANYFTDDRIVNAPTPPSDWRPADGPLLLILPASGTPDYEDVTLSVLVALRTYGLTEIIAETGARTVFDGLKGHASTALMVGFPTDLGRMFHDPQVDWRFKAFTYRFLLRNS